METLDLDFSKMKKKKPKRDRSEDFPDIQGLSSCNTKQLQVNNPSEDFYTYEFMLKRLIGKINNSCPSLMSEPTKAKVQTLDVQREGTRKTVVSNFGVVCKSINRDKDHVFSFFMAELCCDGSIDANNRLIIKGRYAPAAISSIARKYIEQYVLCSGCKGIDTIIDRDKGTRLSFLRCGKCQAHHSIKPIEQGFRAKI